MTMPDPDVDPDENLYCVTEECDMFQVPIANPFDLDGIFCGTCGADLHGSEPPPEDTT